MAIRSPSQSSFTVFLHSLPSQSSFTVFLHSLPSQSSFPVFLHSLPSQSSFTAFLHSLPSQSSFTVFPHSLPSQSFFTVFPHSLPSQSFFTAELPDVFDAFQAGSPFGPGGGFGDPSPASTTSGGRPLSSGFQGPGGNETATEITKHSIPIRVDTCVDLSTIRYGHICVPSGFMVVFEKRNRGSFSCTHM